MDIENVSRRRRASAYDALTPGQLKASPIVGEVKKEQMRPESNFGLGVATVVNIDYEGLFVTLRTVLGASETFERVPTPLTFPGAGARHFCGSMPEIGDVCVIGWSAQESGARRGTNSPVILAWLLPGVWPGYDWLMTAEFEADEVDQNSPRDRTEGVYNRIRHKLRHMQPGNFLASSSQGSDLVLDEGVLLTNRRGNEFRLRDQDQAAVLRALQKFDALAGVRTYAGMVQRDANLLHPTMVSDGLLWDGPLQMLNGVPVPTPKDTKNSKGVLTPAKTLQKSSNLLAEDGYLGKSMLGLDQRLDPYTFLRQGGFIYETGYVASGVNWEPNTLYGGKPIFRVTAQSKDNAAANSDARTLTEYRIEVTHTSDGRLPVTEQTDMFDAERLPDSDSFVPNGTLPPNVPFIEWSLGSVVGNDPFTEQGKRMYGLPLKAVIFNGDTASPHLEPANLVLQQSGASPTPLKEQAATLFRLLPPLEGGGPATFWSVNKQGQMKAAIGGPPGENSLEAYLYGGLKLMVDGDFSFSPKGGFHVEAGGHQSIGLEAKDGAVRIYGGGPVKDQSAQVERTVGQGEETLPSVVVEAKTNALLKAGKTVYLKGETIDENATAIQMTAHDSISLDGVKQISSTTECYLKTVNGKESESWSGPKMLLPTNGALHERTYTPNYPGVTCEKVLYVMGDREETFYLGKHSTSIKVGSMAYEVKLGTWSAKATTSSLNMGPSGISGVASLGTVSLKASTGAASMTGMTGVTIAATAGRATVRGGAGVYLGGPPTEVGSLIVSGSRDPLTGLPFLVFGMGAKSFIVGA